jgi:hypothetical protein
VSRSKTDQQKISYIFPANITAGGANYLIVGTSRKICSVSFALLYAHIMSFKSKIFFNHVITKN